MRRSASSSLYWASSSCLPAMPKKPPRPPGLCIFCRQPGLTKEHMYADWLRNYIPRELSSHGISIELTHLHTSDQTVERQTGDPHSRRIKCVCRKCNNGWMSRLQEQAKPYLVPMLRGEPVTLRKNGQTAVAAWVTMMVMVGEHLNQKLVAVPLSDRQWLMNHGRSPSHWRVWIGRHRATNHPPFTHNVMSSSPRRKSRDWAWTLRKLPTRKPLRYSSASIFSFM